MHQITDAELWHAISFAVKGVSKGTLRDLNGSPNVRQPAIELVTRAIIARLDRFEILVPEVDQAALRWDKVGEPGAR